VAAFRVDEDLTEMAELSEAGCVGFSSPSSPLAWA